MVSGLPPDELLSLYQASRQIIWRYQLDKLETAALKTAMRSTEKAAEQIFLNPTEKLKKWEQLRRQDLIREIDSVTLGIREQVSGEISSLAGQAGAESAKYHSQTMSLGGKVAGFNNVALSPEQFRSFFQTTPLGGHTLNGWVDRAFDATVRQGILEDLGAGVLQGKGYRGLVNNIMGHMEGFTRKEAVTLARSFVQQANVTANDAVMAANRDIIKKWKWSAVLEGGNMASGRGTCISCSVLDGQEFEFGEGPPMILHPRCRCVRLPILVSYRDLGIDVDELEDVARPWTERPDIPIGEGGRNITSWGTHKGEYASWFNSRGEQFQKNVVGPKRLALIQSGKVTFKDLVDPQTGRLYRLDELVSKKTNILKDLDLSKKLTKAEFTILQKQISDDLNEYIVKTWGSLEEFRDDIAPGDKITLPKNLVVPRTVGEWNDATVGGSFSSGRIVLGTNEFTGTGVAPELAVFDGHNRLKALLADKSIKNAPCIIYDRDLHLADALHGL